MMMNIHLPMVPERTAKPRANGLNMIMDKGLSCTEAASLIDVAGHLIDYVKLGFGTSLFTANLARKVELYLQADIRVYLGGTLLEACKIRGAMDEYLRFADQLGIRTIEVSDGSMVMPHNEKCQLIEQLTAKGYTVLSEVGSKMAGVVITPQSWIEMMQKELEAGSKYVIAEARESGNIGIFDAKGAVNQELIDTISQRIPLDKILWEAPQKSQQAWFVKHFGTHVNLGNIPSNEVIALETLRCGLRGDTFAQFLSPELQALVQK